jgi:predicted FMN-binding regulatory protein PaiB
LQSRSTASPARSAKTRCSTISTRIADLHEPRPDPWTRSKADPAAIDAMLRAITGKVTVTALRGTDKLSQNKPPTDRALVSAAGNAALPALVSR